MKLIIISDTHGQHESLPKLPDGDMLIHCGDWSIQGSILQTSSFLNWFSSQEHQYKIMIAGNHDRICENQLSLFREMLPTNVSYLQDSGETIEGVKIWGTPHCKQFGGWAFNQSSDRLTDYFNLIPTDTQILISHAPAYGILDSLKDGTSVGEPELSNAIDNLSQLKLVCCGHIHESYGRISIKGVRYVNAALLDANYRPRNNPWIIYL